MKKIAVGFLTILLCTATSLHAQLNNGTDVRSTSLRTEQPTGVPQNVSLDARGTDVRSTSLRMEQPTGVPQNVSLDVRGTIPLSTQNDTSSCASTLYLGEEYETDGNFQAEEDTLKYFIEQCFAQPFSYQAFGYIDNAVEQIYPDNITDNQRFFDLRNWLFSVLYLNTDTNYYCGDADALLTTFAYRLGSRGVDFKGEEAVEQYLIESGKCPHLVSLFQTQIKELRQQIYLSWKDTVQDSLTTPFDTTLPTLQQIGFQALLGPEYAAVHNGIIPTSVLGKIGIAPNPFIDNTVVDYTLNVPATLTVEVFNALGERVAAPVPSVFTNNGDYSLTVSGSALASGTYYVRFAVPEGEVRTIMITKQ